MTKIIEAKALISAGVGDMSGIDKMSAKLLAVSKAGTMVKNSLGSAGSDMAKQIEAIASKLSRIDNFRTVSRGLDNASVAMRQAHQEAARLKRELDATASPGRAMQGEYNRAAMAVQRATAAFREQGAAVREARSSLIASGIPINQIAKQQAELTRHFNATTAAMQRQAAAGKTLNVNPWGAAPRSGSGVPLVPLSPVRPTDPRHGVGLSGLGGLPAAHFAREGARRAIMSGGNMDYAVRRQRAFADLSEEDQRRIMIPQAEKIGADTKFTPVDIVEAQTTTANRLPAHMKNAATIAPLVGQMKNYALSMKDTTMDEAAQAITGFLMSTGKDIGSPEKADFEARRASNLLIRMSKLGAMSHHDLMPFVQRGVSAGRIAGLSDETMGALAVGMKRSNISGDQAGTALRTLSSKLVAPTDKGLAALATAGIDYSKYAKMPGGLSVDSLEGKFRQDFGKSFTPEIREKLKESLSDSEVIADRGRFTEAVTEAVSSLFTPKKDGTMKAADRKAVAKKAGEFHKFSTESVDSEGLLQAILAKDPTLGVLNAFATDKHGNKIGLIAKAFEQFERDRQTLRETPGNFGDKISETITGGLGGALERLTGAVENAYTRLGRANEFWLAPSVDKLGNAIEAVSQLPEKLLVFGTALGTATAALLAIKGASTAATIAGATATTVGATAAGATLTRAGQAGSAFVGGSFATMARMALPGAIAYGMYDLLERGYEPVAGDRDQVKPGEAHNFSQKRRRAYHEALRSQTDEVRRRYGSTLEDAGIMPLGAPAQGSVMTMPGSPGASAPGGRWPGGIEAVVKPDQITAKADVNVQGQAQVSVQLVPTGAFAGLIQAAQANASAPLQGGSGPGSTGRSMPEAAAPTGGGSAP